MKAIKTALLSLTLFSSIHAEIKELHNFQEIEKYLSSSLTSSDWIVFDVDYTLTEPEHPALQMAAVKQDKQRFSDELARFSEEQKQIMPALVITHAPSQLTDPSLPALIQKLKQQGATVFAFTAADTAHIPDIGLLPEWRVAELRRLGINFTQSIHSPLPQERLVFQEFSSFRGTYPLYEEGVLYANVLPSKGEVLSAFLEKVCQKPKKILFIDDTLKNLESVEAELEKRGIAFLGLHYKAPMSTQPPVSNEEWRAAWDKIHKKAQKMSCP